MTSGVYTRIKTDPILRFNQKHKEVKSGCWEWTACLSPQGYGQFWDGNTYCLAHRFSYEIKNGKIPKGLVIDHLCRNPCCVNPEHLECVTMAENTRRGALHDVIREKHRMQTHCMRGHPLDGDNLSTKRNGHRGCKKCQKMKAKEWKKEHRESVNEKQRLRRSKERQKTKLE